MQSQQQQQPTSSSRAIKQNQFESHCRQRHQSNQAIKPEPAQTTIPWSNAKESHNGNQQTAAITMQARQQQQDVVIRSNNNNKNDDVVVRSNQTTPIADSDTQAIS